MKQRHIPSTPLPSPHSTAFRRATSPQASHAQLSSRAPYNPNGPSDGTDRTIVNAALPQFRHRTQGLASACRRRGNGPLLGSGEPSLPAASPVILNRSNNDFINTLQTKYEAT